MSKNNYKKPDSYFIRKWPRSPKANGRFGPWNWACTFRKSKHSANLTQDLVFSNLLSLPHLPTRKTKGRERLVDYSQSLVVTFDKYLRIMRQKAMEKEVVQEVRQSTRKEREEKHVRKVVDSQVVVGCVAQKNTKKQDERQARLDFVITWSPATWRNMRNNYT